VFSPQLPESSRLDVTLARLRALVGDAHVGSPQLKDTHAPDSFLVQGFAVSRAKAVFEAGLTGAPAVRRVRPPVPVAMRMADTGPIGFWYGSRMYQVVTAHGPWRESGDWWSAAFWSREQWDIIAEGSASLDKPSGRPEQHRERLCCRLVYDLLLRQWALEAIYD
jgi:protein ImuB